MTSHHDVAGVVAELRQADELYKTGDVPYYAIEELDGLLERSADLLESQAKALSEAEANLALLSDPISVHINMCRGTIAKPSWENLRHLFPVIYDLEHAERRALAAEARLAEAMKVIEPFAKAAIAYDPDEGEPNSIADKEAVWGDDDLEVGHLRAARAFTNAAKTQESKDA